MKYFELNKEEKKILVNFDKGDFVSVNKIKFEKKKYQNYAKLNKFNK